MSFSYIEIFLIVLSQLILLFLFNFMMRKSKKKHDVFKDKLELINSILSNTRHDKIAPLDEIKKVELDADEITIFSADI